MDTAMNQQKGMYVPQLERDACGTGLIANLNGTRSNEIISNALTMLENMDHRGACGCEPNTGDGAGILTHIPHKFFATQCAALGFKLPGKGGYGVAMCFLPKNEEDYTDCNDVIDQCANQLGFTIIGKRAVPIDNSMIGASALATEPDIEQVFFEYKEELNAKELDRKLFVLRNHITHSINKKHKEAANDFYIASCSSRVIIYKGQLTSQQVRAYFHDLSVAEYESAIALVHSRFSTNTVPKWKLAQPFRYISHNGEINTIQGNINWWKAREELLESSVFTKEELDIVLPICDETGSDSSNFDNVLEFLVHNGRSIPHALMMMIPEAWQNDPHIAEYKKDFYEYHDALMEPWDGPASITFTDGTLIGATLDRNGLRPSRYLLTEDNVLILASETGVLPVDPSKVVLKNRLEPGKILIADLDEHRIIGDEELKDVLCKRNPYKEWLNKSKHELASLKVSGADSLPKSDLPLVQQQIAYGFIKEDKELLLKAMSENGKEPIGSMGTDIPLAALSKYAQHIASYFKQQFAQVTNPPIDPLREADFMTLKTFLGSCKQILNKDENQVEFIRLESPILRNSDYKILYNANTEIFSSAELDCTFSKSYEEGHLKARVEELCAEAVQLIKSGSSLIILSNRNISNDRVAIPSLMMTGALHHFLIKEGLRMQAGIIVDGGDIVETHHFATLISYGADAIYPRVAINTLKDHGDSEQLGEGKLLVKNYLKAVEKGLLKVMSKLGISTVLSYKGAQTFEALGISMEVVDICFKGTISRIEGMTFDMLAKEALTKHRLAFEDEANNTYLQDLGVYQWKRRGEYHLFNPTTIHLLQNSTMNNDYQIYKKFSAAINKQEHNACTLRSMLDIKPGTAIPIEEVESAEKILTRFATGAMSFGSISHEAHTTLAIAMNRIGGKSNSGEGGEDETRFEKKENGDWERSAIKQVASGRFGVTINYLTNAEELQIKMAQGAKPGEGGQLPGHKVNDWIARVRNSTPGVGLISPPPHHDIYSIEDLAQLIFDLKNANREARISVKLVSKAGVGIIASGVTKGHADHILISGHDGGTGASPLSSLRHCGLPWELGLSETHQTLVKNKLRDRVRVQVDGQIRTGRDLAIATMLGAEEWGIATAALVVEGCILMRKCHLNTCPVGIATQDPELRKKFDGKVEHVVNYFNFLAEDMREIMASLGFRTVDEMVGRSDCLKVTDRQDHWKLKSLNLEPILYRDKLAGQLTEYKNIPQDHGISEILDRKLIEYSKQALGDKVSIQSIFPVINTDRAVGTMLSNEISKMYGADGLEDDAINFRFKGSAGQSFGAFGAKGLTFTLEGDTNDYFGKGLSGAKLILVPDRNSTFDPAQNIIIGNVSLYGATSGEAYIKGMAGERFAVRNSGAKTVVEGVGAHGCEYMTGGMVVILGEIGRNFAAGMSGGISYVYDPSNNKEQYFNKEMVYLEVPEEEDFAELRRLIRNHFKYTGSENALKILQSWDNAKFQFIKVMPKEYKAVLEKMKSAAALETASVK